MASYNEVLAAFGSLREIAKVLRDREQPVTADEIERCVTLIQNADNARIQQVVDIVSQRRDRQEASVQDWRNLTITYPGYEGWVTLGRVVHDLEQKTSNIDEPARQD